MAQLMALVLVFLSTTIAYAHPVSFKGAFGLMSYNSSEMNELLLTYSFNPRFAVATTYLRTDNSEFYIPRINFLVNRRNNEDSQANIYLSAGAGIEKFGSKTYKAQMAEIVVDWESRKYYTYFEHQFINRENQDSLFLPSKTYNHSKGRLGFAPFLADYEDLNVWIIGQVDRHNDEKQIEFSQFLRFYKKNVLWEIGSDFKGSIAFNFMVHL